MIDKEASEFSDEHNVAADVGAGVAQQRKGGGIERRQRIVAERGGRRGRLARLRQIARRYVPVERFDHGVEARRQRSRHARHRHRIERRQHVQQRIGAPQRRLALQLQQRLQQSRLQPRTPLVTTHARTRSAHHRRVYLLIGVVDRALRLFSRLFCSSFLFRLLFLFGWRQIATIVMHSW